MTKQYIALLTEHKVKLLCLRERVSSDISGFSPFSTKKQSVHYRILRSYKDTLHGRSVIIGFQKTQIYQRFAGSRQEVFILKIQNDESNAAQQDNGRRFHIEIKQKQGQYFLLFLFDSIELLLHHSLQKHPRLLLQRYSDRSV